MTECSFIMQLHLGFILILMNGLLLLCGVASSAKGNGAWIDFGVEYPAYSSSVGPLKSVGIHKSSPNNKRKYAGGQIIELLSREHLVQDGGQVHCLIRKECRLNFVGNRKCLVRGFQWKTGRDSNIYLGNYGQRWSLSAIQDLQFDPHPLAEGIVN